MISTKVVDFFCAGRLKKVWTTRWTNTCPSHGRGNTQDAGNPQGAPKSAVITYLCAFFEYDSDGLYKATLLVPVVLAMVISDAVLGVDCAIAKIEEIDRPFLNVSSSLFALFGIRASYEWIATIADRWTYTKQAISVILVQIGLELMIMDFINVNTLCSLLLMSCTFVITGLFSECKCLMSRRVVS